MSNEPAAELPARLETGTITIIQYMDGDGDYGQIVRATEGMTLINALGMLEYAKMQLSGVYDHEPVDGGDESAGD